MRALVVHGGAGPWAEELRDFAAQGLEEALEAGWKQSTALEMVVAAVRVLEDDPLFNAGIGASFNSAGYIEHDAGVMEGSRLNAGAVAAVRDIRHPVDLACKVLEDGRHVLLVGDGASAFAREAGVELADPLLFEVERRRRELQQLQQFDTVGAVARDAEGHYAVAVSTGGYTGKLPGRVGDSPIPGAGFYADDAGGAACATGRGEGFLRTVLCKEIVDHLVAGWSAQAAANDAIERLAQRVEGVGGVVVIDSHGRAAAAFNTPHMPWAERHQA